MADKISTEEMQALLAADKEQREQDCIKEYEEQVKALCDKHRCVILPVPFIRLDGRISAQVIVQSK